MLADGTLPGFVYMEDSEHVELMVHPTDKKTGIQYRLLPMQQSMIGELLSPEQADHHVAIIKEHLQFPDGVRLMNRPATYAVVSAPISSEQNKQPTLDEKSVCSTFTPTSALPKRWRN